jgi:hypothetical protein
MTPREFLRALYDGKPPKVAPRTIETLRLNPGLEPQPSGSLFARLPPRHKALLTLSNGLDFLSGAYRLFGFGASAARDMAWWNRPDTWTFAWGARADPYVYIGESVLGNQYAYRTDELKGGGAARVFELYAVTLDEVVTFQSFDDFLDRGFLNGVRNDPYHGRIADALRQMGAFDLDKHLAYMPSPLLTGGEIKVQKLLPMTARAHMIVNGDLWCQLAHRDSLARLKGLENYQDEEGRLRIRALWA